MRQGLWALPTIPMGPLISASKPSCCQVSPDYTSLLFSPPCQPTQKFTCDAHPTFPNFQHFCGTFSTSFLKILKSHLFLQNSYNHLQRTDCFPISSVLHLKKKSPVIMLAHSHYSNMLSIHIQCLNGDCDRQCFSLNGLCSTSENVKKACCQD